MPPFSYNTSAQGGGERLGVTPQRREEESAGMHPKSVFAPPGREKTGDTREEERCRRPFEHRAQGGGERPVRPNIGRREEESVRCIGSGV